MTTSEASIVYDQHEDEHSKLFDRKSYNYAYPIDSKESPTRKIHMHGNNRHHIQHISPIKYDPHDYRIQFSHSTPNHHLLVNSSSKTEQTVSTNTDDVNTSVLLSESVVLPILTQEKKDLGYQSIKKYDNVVNLNLKNNLVKQLAASLLELNNLHSQSDHLEAQLKASSAKFKTKGGSNNNNEVLRKQLENLKTDMLHKIDSIHDLEMEVIKIDENSKTPNMPQQRMKNILIEMKNMFHEMNNNTSNTNNLNSAKFDELFDEIDKNPERTVYNLLSAIMKSKIESTGQPTVTEKIGKFSKKLDYEMFKLKQKIDAFEEKLKSPMKVSVEDLDELRNMIAITEQRIDDDKAKLIKEIENEKYMVNSQNRKVIGKAIIDLQNLLIEQENDMRDLLRKVNLKFTKIVNKNTAIRRTDSSFLSEEEETIKRISERIKILRTKIDSRENDQVRSQDDDRDTVELIELTEQIKYLRNKMMLKEEKLKSVEKKVKRSTNGDRVYLPLYHSKKKRSSDEDVPLSKPLGQTSYISPKRGVQILKPRYSATVELNNDHVNNMELSEELSSDNEETYNNRVKFYIVNKSGHDDVAYSPERKYTSSIEIPAEQLENIKYTRNKTGKITRRSKSATSSTTTTSTTALIENGLKKSNLKNSSKIPSSKSMIAVNVGNTGVEKQTMTDFKSPSFGEKSKKLLKNVDDDTPDNNKDLIYLLKLLENRDKKIALMKEKIVQLKDFKNQTTHDTDSCSISNYLDVLKNTIKNSLTNTEEENKDLQSNSRAPLNKNMKSSVKYNGNNDNNDFDSDGDSDDEEDNKTEHQSRRNSVKRASRSKQSTDKVLYARNRSKSELVDSSVQVQEGDFYDQTHQSNLLQQTYNVSQPIFTPVEIPQSIPNELICNIPEHHFLEDMTDRYREKITKLKYLLRLKDAEQVSKGAEDDSVAHEDLVEKRAEFEALDLAISERKKRLYELEMRKRSTLGETVQHLESQSESKNRLKFIKDEIYCTEATLKKRNNELHQMRKEINETKKELMSLTDSKLRLENELNGLSRTRKLLNEETVVFDRKAEEATKHLILVNEDLANAKREKIELENDLNVIKEEILNFLNFMKSNRNVKYLKNSENSFNFKYFENILTSSIDFTRQQHQIDDDYKLQKETRVLEQAIIKQNIELDEITRVINKQKSVLQSLDNEVLSKKNEIDSLRDRSIVYSNDFKKEIETTEADLAKLKKQKHDVNNYIVRSKEMFDNLLKHIRPKTDGKVVDKDSESLNEKFKEIETYVEDKRDQLKSIQNSIDGRNKEYEVLTKNFTELQNRFDQINKTLTDEKSEFKQLAENLSMTKKQLNQMNEVKTTMDGNLKSLKQNYDELSEDFKKREKQLNELNEMHKAKQELYKKEEEAALLLRNEKDSLAHEMQDIREKLKKKKIDLERFDEANKAMDTRLMESQNELKKNLDRIKEAKQDYEKVHTSIQEEIYKIQDLQKEKAIQQQLFNDLSNKMQVKKNDFERLNSDFMNLQQEYDENHNHYERLQLDTLLQKKENDNLILKNKEVSSKLRENEYIESRFEDLELKLQEKHKYIEELEMRLTDKTNEMQYLDQDFLKAQDEILELRNVLGQIEEEFKKRENILENELKNLMLRLEQSQDEFLSLKITNEKRISLLEKDIQEKEIFIKQMGPLRPSMDLFKKNPILLYKPSNLIKDVDLNSNLYSSLKLKDFDNGPTNIKQPINKQIIEEEQQKLREILQNTLLNRENAIEKSKLQRIGDINSLKSKLHDIELLSGSFSVPLKTTI